MIESLPSCSGTLHEAFIREFDGLPTDSIWLVHKVGFKFTLTPAKPMDFKEWLRQHRGFFSKFPRRIADWTKGDRFQSIKILGDHRSTFYAHILPDDIKTYPSS